MRARREDASSLFACPRGGPPLRARPAASLMRKPATKKNAHVERTAPFLSRHGRTEPASHPCRYPVIAEFVYILANRKGGARLYRRNSRPPQSRLAKSFCPLHCVGMDGRFKPGHDERSVKHPLGRWLALRPKPCTQRHTCRKYRQRRMAPQRAQTPLWVAGLRFGKCPQRAPALSTLFKPFPL